MKNSQMAFKIKELCNSSGVSITDFLEKCNLTKSFMYDLERRDSSPSFDKIERIADYFNCSVDYLIGHTISPQSSEFYRIFLSDKGIKVIKKYLKPVIEGYGTDRLSEELNLDFRDVEMFLNTSTPGFDYKCLSMLDKILLALDTDVYSIMRESFFMELQAANPQVALMAARSLGNVPVQLLKLTDDVAKRLDDAPSVTSEEDL